MKKTIAAALLMSITAVASAHHSTELIFTRYHSAGHGNLGSTVYNGCTHTTFGSPPSSYHHTHVTVDDCLRSPGTKIEKEKTSSVIWSYCESAFATEEEIQACVEVTTEDSGQSK